MADTAKLRRHDCPYQEQDKVAVPGDYFYSSLPKYPPIIGCVQRVFGNRVDVRWEIDNGLSKVEIEDLVPIVPPTTTPLPIRETPSIPSITLPIQETPSITLDDFDNHDGAGGSNDVNFTMVASPPPPPPPAQAPSDDATTPVIHKNQFLRRHDCPYQEQDKVAVPGDYFYSSLPKYPPIIGCVQRVFGNRVDVRWEIDNGLSKVEIEDLVPIVPPTTTPLPIRETPSIPSITLPIQETPSITLDDFDNHDGAGGSNDVNFTMVASPPPPPPPAQAPSDDATTPVIHKNQFSKKRRLVLCDTSAPSPESDVPSSVEVGLCKVKRARRRRQPPPSDNVDDDDGILYLRDALEDAYNEAPDDEEVDIVLLPPCNSQNGDTDVEDGDDESLNSKTLDKVCEVSGTLVVQSSRDTSRVSKQKVYKDLPPNYQAIVKEEQSTIKRIMDSDTVEHDDKIMRIIESSVLLDSLRKWETADDSCETPGLPWKTQMSADNSRNLEDLITICQGKLPVEIFELLSKRLKQHVVLESNRYARQRNNTEFTLTTSDLDTFVAFLLFSGYHSLPQRKLYWERNRDVSTPMIFESISKNKCCETKRYIHFADNTTIDISDKFAKVRPLYDITNDSLQQFGHWHLNYSIDEQMVPYFGMHSAKQTNRAKSVRFGYKNFVLASADGYPYRLIPYSGAKGVGGTSGKDLTLRVVLDLVLQSGNGIGNLAFDNWYTSARLMSALAAMDIPTVATARSDRVGGAPLMTTTNMGKKKRGTLSYAIDKTQVLHCVNWMDNAVVTLMSNSTGPYPLNQVERFSKSEKKKVLVPQPAMIKLYNESMGGVDLIDAAVATYRPVIRGKKWYWPHFLNTIGVLMGAAWRIYRATTVETDLSLLFFVRSVVQSYLHHDKIISGPRFVTGKSNNPDSVRYTGKHYPRRIKEQRRCRYNKCQTKVRFICVRCDVGLCIENDHFILYHEK